MLYFRQFLKLSEMNNTNDWIFKTVWMMVVDGVKKEPPVCNQRRNLKSHIL